MSAVAIQREDSAPAGVGDDGSDVDAGDRRQYLTFVLDGEEYGVDILKVQEIKGWSRATPIPNTRDFVCGAINMRGAIVPVFDLRRRFGLAPVEYGATTVVIVVRVETDLGERTVGIVVDAVSDVFHVADSSLQQAPDAGSSIGTAYVRGLATVNDNMVIVLDVDRLIGIGILGDAVSTEQHANGADW